MNLVSRKPGLFTTPEEAMQAMQTEVCRRFMQAYCADLSAAGSPENLTKRAFDAVRYTGSMPYMMLTEVIDRNTMPVRIVGEAMTDHVGARLKGSNYLDFVVPRRRETVSDLLTGCITWPFGYRVIYDISYRDGLPKRMEAAGVPLRPEAGARRIGHLLCVEVPYGRTNACLNIDQVPLHVDIIERQLIDLGHGVDESFSDLVIS